MRRNTDEDRLRARRFAALGDVGSAARLLSSRVRSGDLPARNLHAAALMGVPEAEVALGLDAISPEESHDRLLLLLDTGDRAYSVLWAWASARAAIDLSNPSPYRASYMRLLDLVESWLADPVSETAQRCRDMAYDVATIEEPSSSASFVTASVAWAGLSVMPWTLDFPAVDTGTGRAFMQPGSFPATPATDRVVLPLDLDGVRDSARVVGFKPGVRVEVNLGGSGMVGDVVSEVFESRPGVPSVVVRWESFGVGEGAWPIADLAPLGSRGGASVPALATRFELPPDRLLEGLARRLVSIRRVLVRLDVAAAAWAHLFAVWSAESHGNVTIRLDLIAGLVATRVRPWLLGEDLRGAFRHGRDVLVGPTLVEDPTPRCQSCEVLLNRATDMRADDAGEIWTLECAACRGGNR